MIAKLCGKSRVAEFRTSGHTQIKSNVKLKARIRSKIFFVGMYCNLNDYTVSSTTTMRETSFFLIDNSMSYMWIH